MRELYAWRPPCQGSDRTAEHQSTNSLGGIVDYRSLRRQVAVTLVLEPKGEAPAVDSTPFGPQEQYRKTKVGAFEVTLTMNGEEVRGSGTVLLWRPDFDGSLTFYPEGDQKLGGDEVIEVRVYLPRDGRPGTLSRVLVIFAPRTDSHESGRYVESVTRCTW